jgi:hypothetical protein
MLEFIACKDSLYGEWKLPGGKILGNVSQYSIVCTCFGELVFEKTNFEQNNIKTEEDMKNFFANFAVDSNTNERELEKDGNNDRFIAKMIYKGYIDDPRK